MDTFDVHNFWDQTPQGVTSTDIHGLKFTLGPVGSDFMVGKDLYPLSPQRMPLNSFGVSTMASSSILVTL